MDRYWEANSAADAPAPPASGTGGYPTDGSPVTGVPPTTPGAWWYHLITEEIRNAIALLGATPDYRTVDQLEQAILAALQHVAGSIDYNDLVNKPTGFVPVGAGLPFFAGVIPAGFLLANGAAVSRTTYAALFAAIGTLYGAPDANSFYLPDSRGIVLRGLDNGRGLDAGRALGSYQSDAFGWHSHELSDPGHAHGVYDPGHGHGVGDPGHSHSMPPGGWGQAGKDNGGGSFISQPNQYGTFDRAVNDTYARGTGIWIGGSGTGVGIYGNGTGISVQGTGGAETRGKNLAVNFIIKY